MPEKVSPRFSPDQFRFLYEGLQVLIESAPASVIRKLEAHQCSTSVFQLLEETYNRVRPADPTVPIRVNPIKTMRSLEAAEKAGYVKLTHDIDPEEEAVIDSLRQSLRDVDAVECRTPSGDFVFLRHLSEWTGNVY